MSRQSTIRALVGGLVITMMLVCVSTPVGADQAAPRRVRDGEAAVIAAALSAADATAKVKAYFNSKDIDFTVNEDTRRIISDWYGERRCGIGFNRCANRANVRVVAEEGRTVLRVQVFERRREGGINSKPWNENSTSRGRETGELANIFDALMSGAAGVVPSESSSLASPEPVIGEFVQSPTPQDEYRFGAGGRLGGSHFGVGASVRGWASPRIGGEFQISRWSMGTQDAKASVTQFGPLVLFRLGEPPPTANVTVRPYVGGGLNFFRSSLTLDFGGLFEDLSESDNSTGIQMVGGVEMAFQDAPRFVVSADLGYHSTGQLFGAVSVGGMAFSVSGHWYFK